jgi:hypothetical protein
VDKQQEIGISVVSLLHQSIVQNPIQNRSYIFVRQYHAEAVKKQQLPVNEPL